MKPWTSMIAVAALLTACSADDDTATNQDTAQEAIAQAEAVVDAATDDVAEKADAAAETLATMTDEQRKLLNTTPVTADRYPSPLGTHYGPKYGSIQFTDTDPGPTIGGTLTMQPAVDENGVRIDEAEEGITMYMVHWGLEVGAPGTEDDKGSGDLGGDCMGFRDTGHVVSMPAADAGDVMTWEIPEGTVVPEGAVYFVGHALYGNIHNLAKCTQTPIDNKVE